MVQFTDLAKAFKDNFSASIAAVMVFAIFGLSGYIVQLQERMDNIGAERLSFQIKCAQEVAMCEQYWRSRMDSLQLEELEKTKRQVDELNKLLKQVKQ